MVDRLTDNQVKGYRAVFDENKNENNEVEYRYLEGMLTKLGIDPTPQQMEEVFEDLDVYCHGTFSFPHFVQIMAYKFVKDIPITKKSKKARVNTLDEDLEEEMREAFRVFDGDGNGFISQAELKHALVKMGEKLSDEEIEEMMVEADKDGDGQISFQEFCAMMPDP